MGKLRIGWAQRDVTPDCPVYIPGTFEMRISEKIIDPITTTALVVEDDNDIAIFLSMDLVVIRCFLLDEIRGKVRRKNPAIPVMKILASAMHQHTAPSHYYDGGEIDETIKEQYTPEELQKMLDDYIPTSLMGVPRDGMEFGSSDKYRDFLSDKAAEAICEAYEKRAEAGISYGYSYAVVSHSRRTVYFDDFGKRPTTVLNPLTSLHGHAVMYGNTNDDQFSHFEAGADHFVNLMFTFDANDKLTGAIINIPCPSQNSEGESRIRLTADYWHDIRKAVRAKFGEDIMILGQCAAGGDLSPHLLMYKQARLRRFALKYGDEFTEEDIPKNVEALERRDIAERVAFAFEETLAWAKNDIRKEAPITHVVKTVELSRRIITDEEYEFCKAQLDAIKDIPYSFDHGSPRLNLERNSNLKGQRNRYLGVIKRYETQKENPKLPMEMHVIRIGDIAFASNRFELYMDYMHRIQARSPFEQTFIVQLAGQPGMGGGSYLATKRGVEGKGYSASMFCNLVSAEGGQELVEETLEILNELAVED